MDGIRNIPDDIILHIVSFISAKGAWRIKAASRDWMNLITIMLDLVFDDSINARESFKFFVDQLVDLQAMCRIKRFSLKLQSLNVSQRSLVTDCVRNVLKRGVFDLELYIKVNEDYPLPFEVFTCKTVVKLSLGSGFVIDFIPEYALLPALKTLTLDSVRFESIGGCVFKRLLSACPVIEELVIDGLNWETWKWCRTLSSLTLKRLIIRREEWNVEEWTDFESISFYTPRLAYLEYNDCIPYGYPIVNFDSLVEARLELGRIVEYDRSRPVDPTNLIKGLKNVEILSLEGLDSLQTVFHDFSEAIPVFENLSHLSIPSEPDFCWVALQLLLEKSPNLKTLTIEGYLHYDYYRDEESVCDCLSEYDFLFHCPVEILKITTFRGDIGEMVQIKHILRNLPCLELLEVHVVAMSDDEKLWLMAELLTFPRASSKCKVSLNFA